MPGPHVRMGKHRLFPQCDGNAGQPQLLGEDHAVIAQGIMRRDGDVGGRKIGDIAARLGAALGSCQPGCLRAEEAAEIEAHLVPRVRQGARWHCGRGRRRAWSCRRPAPDRSAPGPGVAAATSSCSAMASATDIWPPALSPAAIRLAGSMPCAGPCSRVQRHTLRESSSCAGNGFSGARR